MRPWNDQVDEMKVQPIESEVTDIKQFPWNAFRVKEFTTKDKKKIGSALTNSNSDWIGSILLYSKQRNMTARDSFVHWRFHID